MAGAGGEIDVQGHPRRGLAAAGDRQCRAEAGGQEAAVEGRPAFFAGYGSTPMPRGLTAVDLATPGGRAVAAGGAMCSRGRRPTPAFSTSASSAATFSAMTRL